MGAAVQIESEKVFRRVVDIVIALERGAADTGVKIVPRRVEHHIKPRFAFLFQGMQNCKGVRLICFRAPLFQGVMVKEFKTPAFEHTVFAW